MARGDDVRRERVVCLKSDGGCGGRFWRDKGSRRRRCEVCSPPQVKSRPGGAVDAPESAQNPAGGAEAPGMGLQAAGEAVARRLGPVEAATLRQLQARGRVETPEGQLALHIAYQLESRVHSGSQVAAMSRELRDALAMAVAGAPRETDRVDDLFDRRQRRARGVASGA